MVDWVESRGIRMKNDQLAIIITILTIVVVMIGFAMG